MQTAVPNGLAMYQTYAHIRIAAGSKEQFLLKDENEREEQEEDERDDKVVNFLGIKQSWWRVTSKIYAAPLEKCRKRQRRFRVTQRGIQAPTTFSERLANNRNRRCDYDVARLVS